MKKIQIPEAKRLPSGKYMVRFMVDGINYSVTGDTKRSAETAAMQRKTDIIKTASLAAAASKGTVREAIDTYINKHQTRRKLSPSTVRGYRGIQKNQLQRLMDVQCAKITNEFAQDVVDEFAKIRSAKTVRSAWTLVRSAIKEATGRDIIVMLPASDSKEHPFLQTDEMRMFLKAIKGNAYEIPIWLGIHSLRMSEILGLRWENVDLENGDIYVCAAKVLDENNNLVFRKKTKTDKSTRHVAIMSDRLLELLREAPRKTEFVVNANRNTVYRAINNICEEYGFQKIGVHGTRHMFATTAFELNVEPETSARLGGWADIGTMRKIYTHISEAKKATAVKSMKEFFNED